MSKTKEVTPQYEELAFLVYINTDEADDAYVEAELEGLCDAANVGVTGMIRQRLDKPSATWCIGKGKVTEVKAGVADTGASLVIFDCELSGTQVKNLEEGLGTRVLDRTQLILDIFAGRARTREGQLQVELAQLSYMLPRLMGVYTKFERQRGGIGMRGPGEMKLESDRRLMRERIAKLSDEIEDVKRHRDQQRSSRRKHPFPFAAIVGYTSAGKSTLMNRLSGTELLADAMPFATLDPTTRKVDLPEGYSLFLTDTVGFIRHLPTHLVAAFRSTLEEVVQADFLIHVVDISLPNWDMQRDAVLETLESLGAQDKPTLTLFNKVDLAQPQDVDDAVESWPNALGISAATGVHFDALYERLVEMIQSHLTPVQALLPYTESGLVDECYRFGRVHQVDYRDDGIYLNAELVSEMRQRIEPYRIAD